MRRRSILPLLALPVLARGAAAQPAWVPDRVIRLVAPFAPGGAADIIARIIAEELSPLLGQQVIVENRTGAGGAIGTEFVARARPDGYTLVLSGQATHAVTPVVSRLNFDPGTDTTPISNVLGVPMALVVNNTLPVRTLAEFIAYVRARPGQLSYGSAGIGASSHMTMALLLHRAGLDMVHVPYRGSALVFPDIMSGRLAGMTDAITTALGFIRDGRLRGLAVSTRQRLAVLPEVPSASETLPDYETVNWYGVSGPAGLPAPIVATLHGAIQTLLARPAFQERLTSQGMQPLPMGTAEFAAYISRDRAQWVELVRVTGIRAD
jgi:tripartite-type tricarboxylate transporter receptor subunit TctC